MSLPATPRLAVMLSGTGRTLEYLLEASKAGALGAPIVYVIGSRECRGVEIGKAAGVPTDVIKGRIPAGTLEAKLREHGVTHVALAGYLSLLDVPIAYRGRIVNIHPALLPKFGGKGMYGHHVHEAVIAAGERESGCTVHLVDERYDEGMVLAQARCRVEPGDTADALAARVFALEKGLYPGAIAAWLRA
jgi:folate-dependent phosphoribosylglycinamide formyltransferase PurN